MSATLSCCNTCATVETVNVPGPEAAAGVDGSNGINAYTHTTANLTPIPAEGDPITIAVDSSAWMVVGQIVIVGDGLPSVGETGWGHFQVTGIPSATSVTLEFLNYSGDEVAGGTLLSGCTVSPAGMIGPAGP